MTTCEYHHTFQCTTLVHVCTHAHAHVHTVRETDRQTETKRQREKVDYPITSVLPTTVLALGKGPDLQHIEVLGLVGMVDPPREGVREAIQYLQDTGVSVKVITGDAKDTAISVGEKGDVSVVGVWSTSSS